MKAQEQSQLTRLAGRMTHMTNLRGDEGWLAALRDQVWSRLLSWEAVSSFEIGWLASRPRIAVLGWDWRLAPVWRRGQRSFRGCRSQSRRGPGCRTRFRASGQSARRLDRSKGARSRRWRPARDCRRAFAWA